MSNQDDNWLDKYKAMHEPMTQEQEARLAAEQREREDAKLRETLTKRMPKRHLQEASRLLADPGADGVMWRHARDLMAKGEHVRGSDGIFLSGPKGCGKTTAMVAMGLDAARRGVIPWYIICTRFARIVRASFEDRPSLSTLEECPLLILDELHRVAGLPDWIKTPLMGVIDYRYSQRKQTIAAGTLPLSQLSEILGEEVVDRFRIRLGSAEESYRAQERLTAGGAGRREGER
jgi:DNA replication protein DnaC